MSELQHEGARDLLDLISRRFPRGELLTYSSAAELLGRPRDHARAIAQICDLLDAAAAFARTPLLALVAVRSSSGEINPDAWKKGVSDGLRQRIISRSLDYSFGMADYEAIGLSLDGFAGLGNKSAWKFVRASVSDAELFSAIAGTAAKGRPAPRQSFDIDYGAIEGDRRLVAHLRRERNVTLVAQKKAASREKDGGLKCEGCGLNSVSTYADVGEDLWEVHHRQPLSAGDAPLWTGLSSLAILCPSCHRAIHRTRPMLTVERFRKKFFSQRPY